MPTFYYKDKIVIADKLSAAKQLFEYILKTKINKEEIFDYDVDERKKFESVLVEYNGGYIIPFKNGSFYSRETFLHNPVGTFDITKAKVYKRKLSAINLASRLMWIRDYYNNKSIKVDGQEFLFSEIF
jgi:hypothetical protein